MGKQWYAFIEDILSHILIVRNSEFKGNHFLHWGKQYKADEVVVDWHGIAQVLCLPGLTFAI
jgi:hypothetical protein